MSFEEIRFDMSRDGLVELSNILEIEPFRARVSDELLNFINEIRGMVQRAAAVKEVSWLDA